MASAVALVVSPDVRFLNPEETPYPGIQVPMRCLFFDEGLGVNDACGIDVRFPPDATAGEIENAIEDAILECKNSLWPSMSLQRSDMIFFDVKRGSGIL